jgi:hypothetical protein
VTLVNGGATVTVPWSKYLGTGNQQLLAQYSGDSNYAPNISVEVWTMVLPTMPAITLSADAAQVAPGATSSLTVDVQPTLSDPKLTLPYGLVRFYDSLNGGPPQPMGATQSLQAGNGNFTTFVLATTLPQGTNLITVQYLGSPNGQWGAGSVRSGDGPCQTRAERATGKLWIGPVSIRLQRSLCYGLP